MRADVGPVADRRRVELGLVQGKDELRVTDAAVDAPARPPSSPQPCRGTVEITVGPGTIAIWSSGTTREGSR